jgi:2-methylcitrate dehydratase PrpD
MTLKTTDGHTDDKHVEHAVGSLQRPMSEADLEVKFMGLADGILLQQQAKSLLAMCWKLESLPDAAAIPKTGALQRA